VPAALVGLSSLEHSLLYVAKHDLAISKPLSHFDGPFPVIVQL
jgi:hypothetical protein